MSGALLSGQGNVQAPLPGHALEFVGPAVLVAEPGADGEVFDRLGNQHLAWDRRMHDARDVGRDAADVFAAELDLPGVKTGSDLDEESLNPSPGEPIARSR